MGKGHIAPYAMTNQFSLQMYDYAAQVGQLDSVKTKLEKAREISILDNAGVKYNTKDVVFATKDRSGRLYWLEKGNEAAGLTHIVTRHKNDFMAVYGVKEKDIPGFIKNLVLSGNKVAERTKIKNGRITIQQNYEYMGKYYTINAIGSNGFIVSCYPISK